MATFTGSSTFLREQIELVSIGKKKEYVLGISTNIYLEKIYLIH